MDTDIVVFRILFVMFTFFISVMRLSLVPYFKYLGSNIASRNVREGEEVLNANHLILCGSTKLCPEVVDIYALCLQTSALTAAPHIIQGSIELEPNICISKMSCSCKAGAGGKCKHISAVLLHCTRCISKHNVKA